MKATEMLKIMNTDDFWWYYIGQLEPGQKDFSEATVQYRKKFFMVGKKFLADQGASRSKLRVNAAPLPNVQLLMSPNGS